MAEPSNFRPLPRGSSGRKRKRTGVGATTPSAARRTSRSRRAAAAPPKRKANPFGWLKYVALVLIVGVGVYVLANLQPAPPAPPPDFTPDPNATLVPTSQSLFPNISIPSLATALPLASPSPTPKYPEVAIVAGHWANTSSDSVPTVHDSGATCPDGLREVDITKSVADQTLTLLQRRGYRTALLEEFDARLKRVDPDFAPRVFLSIHADSCLTGPDYSFATGYKIAHAEPSDNQEQDDRLVTCLTRSFDRVASKYDKPFNANTITRDMTEYHGFREIDPATPAAIIELGFLGYDRDFLVNHQDEMARGLAVGLDDFLKGSTCLPPTVTPRPAKKTPKP